MLTCTQKDWRYDRGYNRPIIAPIIAPILVGMALPLGDPNHWATQLWLSILNLFDYMKATESPGDGRRPVISRLAIGRDLVGTALNIYPCI